MKKTSILILLLTINIAYGQTNEKFVQLKRNEFDINIGNSVGHFFNKGGEGSFLDNKDDATYLIRIGYKRHFRKFVLRAKFESQSVNPSNYSFNNPIARNSISRYPLQFTNFKLGYESVKPQAFTLFEKKRNIDFYFGADLLAGKDERVVHRNIMYFNNDPDHNYYSDIVATQTRYGIGASPFVGFRLPIRKHWSISSEIGLDMKVIVSSRFNEIYTKQADDNENYFYNQSFSNNSDHAILENEPSDAFSVIYSSLKQTLAIGFHF